MQERLGRQNGKIRPTQSVATAHDVARRAGVSQSAVSRAFTPGASIAVRTRTKILRAAEELGYRPNLIARSLITNRSNIVGVAIGNLENTFFAASLDALSLEFAKAGLRLILFTTSPNSEVETSVQEVLQYRLDALVMLSTGLSSTLATECQKARVPVVLYNRTTIDQSISSVTGDNLGGARLIAALLLAGGHERIAFMAGIAESSTSRQREEGFYGYFAEHGASAPLREQGYFTHQGAAAAARRLLSRRDRPDAIFCANDHMAIAAIDIAQSEFGLQVGRDVSIVGFDDVPMAAWPCFSLTTYSQPIVPMVSETVKIINVLRGGNIEPIHKIVEGELILRTSTRRPVRHVPKAS